MRKILLSFIVLFTAMSVNAQTFEDMLGYYSQTWYSHAHDDPSQGFDSSNRDLWNATKLQVRVEEAGENTLSFTNLFAYPTPVEGVVDLAAKTITFTEQGLAKGEDAFLGRKVAGEDGDKYEKVFVARITEEGNILFHGLAIIYNPETPEEGGEEEGTRADVEEAENEVEEMELELTWAKSLDDNGENGDVVEYLVEKQYIKWAFTLDDGTVVNSAEEAAEDLLYSNDRTKDYNYRFKVKDGFNKIKAKVAEDGHLLLHNDEGAAMSMSCYVTEADFTREDYFYDWMTFSTEVTGSGVGADNNEKSGSLFIKGIYTWSLPNWTTVDKGNITLTVEWLVKDEEEDGIASTATSTVAMPAYNIMGQRVAPTTRGLLIINGKKVVVK